MQKREIVHEEKSHGKRFMQKRVIVHEEKSNGNVSHKDVEDGWVRKLFYIMNHMKGSQ